MDNLLTYLDFSGQFIFDIESESSKSFLNDIISETQENILKDLLGNNLYYAFDTGIQEASPLQKWIDLRDGADFTVELNNSDIIVKYEGLKKMLKFFTYYEFQKNIVNKQTFAGKVNSKFENANLSNALPDMIKKYNKGIDLYGQPFCYNTDIVNYTNNYQLFNEQVKIIGSCYNFLYHKNKLDNTNYPNWYFTFKEYLI